MVLQKIVESIESWLDHSTTVMLDGKVIGKIYLFHTGNFVFQSLSFTSVQGKDVSLNMSSFSSFSAGILYFPTTDIVDHFSNE